MDSPVQFGGDATSCAISDNDLLNRDVDFTLLKSHALAGQLRVHVLPTVRASRRAFNISPGITLPLGTVYRFTRYRFRGQTASGGSWRSAAA